VDPQDPDGRRALEPVFRVELSVERNFGRLGGRAWVRFDHGTEALASRAWRATRQLLLRHLDA
jgi:putative peptide zinc metalloprotease protein